MRALACVAFLLLVVGVPAACATMQKAAARDPLKCEQDPACASGRSSYQDCYRQCVDDPACVERCQSVQNQIDGQPGFGAGGN